VVAKNVAFCSSSSQ